MPRKNLMRPSAALAMDFRLRWQPTSYVHISAGDVISIMAGMVITAQAFNKSLLVSWHLFALSKDITVKVRVSTQFFYSSHEGTSYWSRAGYQPESQEEHVHCDIEDVAEFTYILLTTTDDIQLWRQHIQLLFYCSWATAHWGLQRTGYSLKFAGFSFSFSF